MERAFSPQTCVRLGTWADGPGWDSVGPLARRTGADGGIGGWVELQRHRRVPYQPGANAPGRHPHLPQGLKARPIARPHAASQARISPTFNRTRTEECDPFQVRFLLIHTPKGRYGPS